MRLVAERRLSLLDLGRVLALRALCLGLLMCLSMFLLTEDLELQEKLLLVEQSGVGRVHGWRGLLCFLVWRNVLVVLELFNFWFHIFGLLMAVLV